MDVVQIFVCHGHDVLLYVLEVLALEDEHLAECFDQAVVDAFDNVFIIQQNRLDYTQQLIQLPLGTGIVLLIRPFGSTAAKVPGAGEGHLLRQGLSPEYTAQSYYRIRSVVVGLDVSAPDSRIVCGKQRPFEENKRLLHLVDGEQAQASSVPGKSIYFLLYGKALVTSVLDLSQNVLFVVGVLLDELVQVLSERCGFFACCYLAAWFSRSVHGRGDATLAPSLS